MGAMKATATITVRDENRDVVAENITVEINLRDDIGGIQSFLPAYAKHPELEAIRTTCATATLTMDAPLKGNFDALKPLAHTPHFYFLAMPGSVT